jgi:hypothetical protein
VIQEARAEDRVILDRLYEHLIGPLDVRDYGIHSSSFSRGQGSSRVKGSPSAHGHPSMRGSPSARGTLVQAFAELTQRRRCHSQLLMLLYDVYPVRLLFSLFG